jgi:4-hydroxy 2-oxovalerate aldolase
MKILDCTLRDGGYYTDWNFSKKLVENYLDTVSKLPISIVEIGYLSQKEDLNGPFYHLSNKILIKAKSILRNNQKIYAMINFKELKNSEDLHKLIKNKTKYLDGIRFAVSPFDIEKVLRFIKPLKKKYKSITFNINLMYLSKWKSDEALIRKIFNTLNNKVETVSFVDSFGALKPEEIISFFKRLKNYKKSFKIGCHFHNNCGLALANSLLASNLNCEIVDSTFRGMGRGAGNAATELLLAVNLEGGQKIYGFELNNLLEKFEEIKIKMKWGSSFAYAFAANSGFSQSDMMNLMQKRRLDPGTALKVMTSTKKKPRQINFKKIKNLSKLKPKNKNCPILIGGSPSLSDFGEYLFNKIDPSTPIILSGSHALFNFLNLEIKIYNPIILILSGSEIKKINYSKQKNIFKKINLYGMIVEEDFLPKNINFKNKNKIATLDTIGLNPVLITGLTLLQLKIKKLLLAFFDGNPQEERGMIVMQETQESVDILIKKGLKIFTLTKSFLKVKQLNPWQND